MKNNLFILLIIMFFGFFSFSQNPNITIDGNGIVSCPPGLTALGDYNDIGGKRIYVVDNAAISSILSMGSFSVGASTVTPTDLSCVCTTQITTMEDMFKDQVTFNDDISNWDTSNVTNMQQMFMGTTSFTININSWDVSSVTDMDGSSKHLPGIYNSLKAIIWRKKKNSLAEARKRLLWALGAAPF